YIEFFPWSNSVTICYKFPATSPLCAHIMAVCSHDAIFATRKLAHIESFPWPYFISVRNNFSAAATFSAPVLPTVGLEGHTHRYLLFQRSNEGLTSLARSD